MHTQQADSETASDLEQLRSQLTEWRQTHRPPTPIPSEIWAGAVEIAQKLGVSPTARALRVGYVQLKQRMEGSSPGRLFWNGLRLCRPALPSAPLWLSRNAAQRCKSS